MPVEELLGRGSFLLCMTGAGILLLWMANATASGRLGRNPIAGIRTPVVMATDETWRIAHVRAKRPNQYGGITGIAAGLCALLPLPVGPLLAVLALVGGGLLLAFVLYGARIGGQASAAHLAAERGAYGSVLRR